MRAFLAAHDKVNGKVGAIDAEGNWAIEPAFDNIRPFRGAYALAAMPRTGDDETFADWTADVDDPDVVSFVAGRTDGTATFNPGLKALEEGYSDVTLTNSSTGQSVSFEVEVTAR